MARLDGRVAIVTGAGGGLGREHALFLAAHGALVVVNDLGGDVHGGRPGDRTGAQETVDAIRAAGGEAVVSGHDVSEWEQAGQLVAQAVSTYGHLDVLVNNAGIVRDRTLAKMAEGEWDDVVRVHLKGHAACAHHAMAYWMREARAGRPRSASIVHTSSSSGYLGNFGQANYAAAKLGIVALSRVCSLEGARAGVRSNVVGPAAATRMAATVPGLPLGAPGDAPAIFDAANVSPLVGWLAAADCPADSQVFHTYGNRVVVVAISTIAGDARTTGRWTMDALDAQLVPLLVEPATPTPWYPTPGEIAAFDA